MHTLVQGQRCRIKAYCTAVLGNWEPELVCGLLTADGLSLAADYQMAEGRRF